MQPRTVDEIASFTGGVLVQGDPACVIRGVTTDSRRVKEGQLFIPLKGEHFDGHRFVASALEGGASAAMVAHSSLENLISVVKEHPHTPFISVPETLHALQLLAMETRRRLPRVQGRVLGVTGSVGKTTTKDMAAAIFGVRWATTSTYGNFNNEIGLPLTLLEANDDTQALVLEMGMRGLGEIRELARIATPDVAIVTNVSEVHIERLGTVERIATAKRELVDELSATGTAVLNGDDPRVRQMADHARGRVLFYGTGPDNDVRAADIVLEGGTGVRFVLLWDGNEWPVRVPVPGRHNVYNALAAATAAIALGLGATEINEGLVRFADRRSDMRLQFEQRDDGVLVIDDAYNAGPASMQAALDVLKELPQGRRRIAVLGDMLELGPVADDAHRELGRAAALAGVDVLVAVGRYAEFVAGAARETGMHPADVTVCPTAAEAAEQAERLVRADDIVLVKASRGVALESVVRRLLAGRDTIAFNPKEAPQ